MTAEKNAIPTGPVRCECGQLRSLTCVRCIQRAQASMRERLPAPEVRARAAGVR